VYACCAGVLTMAAAVSLRALVVRLITVNGFMLMLVVLLPWSLPGESLIQLGGFNYSREGLHEALIIVVRGNAILLILTVFIGTMEPHTFGHALSRLRVPEKLTMLLLFTIRYIAVLDREYRQLRRAMTMRSFRPTLNGHTLRTIGYLTGMLLVRALDRSERINEAMRCRGFTGHFPVWRTGHLRLADWCFAAAFCVFMAAFWIADAAGRA
jgi:cobalt/nickel transport system permease protein